MLDGGVRRASHMITLLALGVGAVGLGRSPMYANVYGEEDFPNLLNIIKRELTTELALIGEANSNNFREDTTFINARRVELEFFRAPLSWVMVFILDIR